MVERNFERGLFASRWLMAPMYLGLVVSLAMLVVVFAREVLYYAPQTFTMSSEDAILAVLTLVDLTLAGNLLLIVLFCQNLSPLLHWALSLLPWLSQSHLFLRLHSLVSFSALAAFGLSILTFVLIYTFVPGGRRRMRDQLPGALFTAVVWFVFSSIFTYYIRTSWKLSYIYGSLTSIILVILWLNVSINVMFLGAGINGMRACSRRNG